MATAPTPAATTADSPFDRLSVGLLQQVLQGVPQRERLTQCSLVSRAWAEAAALATTEVDCKPKNSEHIEVFIEWLGKYGGHVRSFVAHGMGQAMQLPWALLKQLQVLKLTLVYIPPIEHTTVPLLPALKQLELQECTLHSFCCLRQLASSPQLTSFKFSSYHRFSSMGIGSWADLSPTDKQQVSTELCSTLQPLQQLVVLQMRGPYAGCAMFQHVAAMQHLQDLQVSVRDTPGDSGATHGLPSSLTRLYISDQRQRKTQLLTNLQPLTSLQELELQSCELSVSSASLGSLTQLHVLRLGGCTLADETQDAAALLRALQQLTCLQSLQLDDTHVHAVPQLFSALTASSQLTALYVVERGEQPLVQGAVQHAFPAGRQLPQLKVFKIVYDCVNADDEQQGWCVDGNDLAAIVSACPHLEQLQVRDVMPRGADVAPLLRLPPSCKLLAVGGDAFNDDAAAVIAQLTHLTELWWDSCASVTDTTLLELTALRDLQTLYMYNLSSISKDLRLKLAGYVRLDDEEEEPVIELHLLDAQEQGRVWQQLEQICDHSPACWRVRMQRQNAAQEAQIALLQQQLADRDAKVAQLQQELAGLRGV